MNPFRKWLVWGSSVATGVTGVVYAWMKYLMESPEPWAVINHPLEPWFLKAHILVAPVMVFAFGLIAGEHVWRHFRCRVPAGRKSGITTALVFLPMVASGYLIQAVTHVGWLQALVVVHLVTGGVYLLGLLAHGLVFRKPRRKEAVGSRTVSPRSAASTPSGRAAPGERAPGRTGPPSPRRREESSADGGRGGGAERKKGASVR